MRPISSTSAPMPRRCRHKRSTSSMTAATSCLACRGPLPALGVVGYGLPLGLPGALSIAVKALSGGSSGCGGSTILPSMRLAHVKQLVGIEDATPARQARAKHQPGVGRQSARAPIRHHARIELGEQACNRVGAAENIDRLAGVFHILKHNVDM